MMLLFVHVYTDKMICGMCEQRPIIITSKCQRGPDIFDRELRLTSLRGAGRRACMNERGHLE